MIKKLILPLLLLAIAHTRAQDATAGLLSSAPEFRIHNALRNQHSVTFCGQPSSFAEMPNRRTFHAEQGTWQFRVSIPEASTGHGQSILSKTDPVSSYGGIHVYEDSGRIALQVKSYNNSVTLTLKGSRIAGNGPHDIVMTYENFSTVRIYVDGVPDAEGKAPYFLFCDAPVRVGCSLDTFWKPLKGTVSDIVILPTVKSATQIQQEYRAAHPEILQVQVLPNPSKDQLLMMLPADDTVLVTIIDVNGNIVLETQREGKAFSVNTEAMVSGTYYVRLKGRAVYPVQKICIAR